MRWWRVSRLRCLFMNASSSSPHKRMPGRSKVTEHAMTPLSLQWLDVWLKKASEKYTHCFTAGTQIETFKCNSVLGGHIVLICNSVKLSPLFSVSQVWQPPLCSQIQCCPLCPLKTRMPPIPSQSHMKVRSHIVLIIKS